MTTVKESTLAKVVAGVVGFSAGLFMLGLMNFAPAAQAQTKAELQSQIQDLLETINNLQAQVDGQNQGSTGSDSYNNCNPSIFAGDLSQGDRGQSVMALQQFLNMSADTRVAASGPGSPGQETSYYGSLTAQAVTSFQEQYSADVLAPLNLAAGTGYWGSSSISKAQELCASAPSDGGDDPDDDEDGTDDDDEDELEGGEASLDPSVDLDDVDDVGEGDEATVADMEFDVEDGDVRVSRVDVAFREGDNNASNADDEPWDVFEEVMLLDEDGDEVASIDASDEDDWLNEDGDAGNSEDYYELRFSDVDTVVREGDTAEFSVAVTAQNNVDSVEDGVEWDVNVLNRGIRAMDGEGINQYTPDGDADHVTFDVEAEGEGEELEFSESSDNPSSSILPVQEDDQSDDYGVFVFDVEADGGDINIEDLPLSFRTYAAATGSTPTFDDIVEDAYLEVEGEEFDYEDAVAQGTSTYNSREYASSTLDFEFDDDEFVVEEDEEVTATLFVSFQDQGGDTASEWNYPEGVGVQALADWKNRPNDFEAEGADDLEADSNDVSGEPEGAIHELRTQGVYIEPNSTDTETSTDNSGNTTQVTHTIEYDLTAFEEDFFVPRGAVLSDTNGSSADDTGVRYVVEDNGGNTQTGSSTSHSLSSTADSADSGNAWQIDQNDTETFTLQVILNSSNYTGFHNVQLEAARYNNEEDVSNSDEEEVQAIPESDFETQQRNLN